MDMKTQLIIAIVPVHNGLPFILKCIESLRAQKSEKFNLEIVVVDDGSTDETSSLVLERYPHVVLLKGDGQLWWTGAIKMGTLYAKTKGADYVFWLNHDDELESGALELLVTHINQKEILCCGVINTHDDQIVKIGYRLNFFKWYIALIEIQKVIGLGQIQKYNIDLNGGHGVLIPMDLFLNSKSPIRAKLFPHYCGDFDFYFQARKLGFKIFSLPRAIIVNHPESSGLLGGAKINRFKQIFPYLFSRKSMGNLRDRPLMALLDFPIGLNLIWFLTFIAASFYCVLFYKFRAMAFKR